MGRAAVFAVIAGCCLLCAGCGALTGVVQTSEPPNVVLILTDDLDASLMQEHQASYPNLRELAADGTTFENAFVTDPLCCPSRATILRTAGYRTVLIGKYMNDYDETRVPPGWDEWYAIAGDYRSTRLNENGEIEHYDPERHHLDDVLAGKDAGYISRTADAPFFMWLGTQAPHAPATPAPRHEDAFTSARLPRPPSFDEADTSDKPAWIRDNPPLNPDQIDFAESLYRKRLQSMLAVDEMIGKLVDTLKHSGELDNTYIFFTSDNGYHMGQHRLTAGKWTAYEEDIRVPLIVRGPGVPEGQHLEHLVLNNDFAPTIAELGGAEAPSFVDGRSLVPLLGEDPPPEDQWRQAFLVEAATELGGVEADPTVD